MPRIAPLACPAPLPPLVLLAAMAVTPTAGAVSLPSPSDLGIRGTLTYKLFAHFEDPADDGYVRNEGILELEWKRRFWGRRATLTIVPEFRIDDGNFAQNVRFPVPDDREHRSIIGLKEGTLKLKHGRFRLELGKLFVAWGTADAFNPTDNVNPSDYLDPIDGFEMGVWAASATFAISSSLSLDFVLVPPFTPSRLPLDRGRWSTVFIDDLPPEFVQARRLGLIPAPTTETDLPPETAENMQYATRLKGTVAGWDLALSYYDGILDTPELDNRTLDPANFTGTVRLFHPRVHVPGLAFSTTWEQFEFHGEAAAIFTETEGREDRVQWIVGLNHTWDLPDVPLLDTIFTLLEYAREDEFTSRGGSEFIDFGTLSNAFRDALIGRVRLAFGDDTDVAVFGTVDLDDSANVFVQPEATHAFSDSLHLAARFDVFSGDRDTFWGRWDDNDRFHLDLIYYF